LTAPGDQIRTLLENAQTDDDLEMACLKYVHRVRNDNNFDFDRNGEANFIAMIAPLCRTIFDIGACVGDWTQKVLTHQPAALVHCFEPLPANHQALVRNLGKRAFVNGFAIGARTGAMALHVPADKGTERWELGSLYQRHAPAVDSLTEVTVQVKTLADYCREQEIGGIDLLKIDTEGAEMDVLIGGRDLFVKGRIKAAQFEYGATWLDARRQLRDVFDLLAGLPYAVAKLMPEGYMIIDHYQPMLDSFSYSNWVILHRDLLSD
jgi:FkbM family methyltransferase